MYTYSFEKLEVWQQARKLVVSIYRLTAKFPSEEKYGIVNQLRRASISICSNLAEGSGRNTSKDQAHFYNLAYSSLSELINQLIISHDLEYIVPEQLLGIRKEIELISARLNRLRISANNKILKK